MKTNEVQFLSEAGKTNKRIDQASGLRELVEIFENKGYEMSVNEKGDITGRRMRRKESVFGKEALIKGQKAFYSKDWFRQVGSGIYERQTMRLVDRVSA
ncbi:hypothetical protein [Campylobacter sp. 7477a]|uniref:hypothetical protein n=1 Tax=Campylobacter sp. 7477a TaxID=2735741 RepID=UPI0030152674|nr:hypothetical protein [Campylobacter sp. 7477a]